MVLLDCGINAVIVHSVGRPRPVREEVCNMGAQKSGPSAMHCDRLRKVKELGVVE